MKLNLRFFTVAALLIGATLQATYVRLVPFFPLSIVLAAATAVLTLYGTVHLLRRRSNVPTILVIGLLLAYFIPLFALFSGRDFSQFIANPLVCILFLVMLAVVATAREQRDLYRTSLPLIVGFTAMVHLGGIVRDGLDVDALLAGHSLVRYGAMTDRNFVNVTGANLSLTGTAGYIYARSRGMPLKGRWLSAASTALLLLPIAATGSRAAWILLIVSVLAFEVICGLVVAKQIRVPLRAVLIMVGLSFLTLAAPEDSIINPLAKYVSQRMELLTTDQEDLRMNAIATALASENFIFGTLKNAEEVIHAARDITVANYLLSYGFIGLVLVSAAYLFGIMRLLIDMRLPTVVGISMAAPLVIRSLAEGTYLPQSIIYCYLLYLVALVSFIETSRMQVPSARVSFS